MKKISYNEEQEEEEIKVGLFSLPFFIFFFSFNFLLKSFCTLIITMLCLKRKKMFIWFCDELVRFCC